MGRKSVKRNYIKGGLLENRSGFNAQTYCCDKQNLFDRGGVNCKKSYTGQCATIGTNAKMRCFNNYPAEGSKIKEGDGQGCEFITGVASKTAQSAAVLGSAIWEGNQASNNTTLGRAYNLNSAGRVSYLGGGLSVKRRRKSNKKCSTKHSKTSKKRHA